MNSVPRDVVFSLCREYGPQLKPPAGLDGIALMAAFAYNESSLGDDTIPRHEPSYDVGGMNSHNNQAPLLAQFGRAAACSYGPWQIMPCNAPSFTPEELFENPEFCAMAFVAFFNSYIVGHARAMTLEQCGCAYNLGHVAMNPPSGVQQYMADLRRHYEAMVGPPRNANLQDPAAAAPPASTP